MNVDLTELDDRITKCQRILEDDPSSQIFAALAEAYRKRKSIDKALDVCRKGLEVHPNYASAYIVMAKIFLDQGSYEEADRQLRKAIDVGGRNRSVDVLESEIFIKLGQKEKARNILGKLHKADPLNDTVKKLLVSLDEISAAIEPYKPAEPLYQMDITRPSDDAPRRAYTLSNALSIIKILPRVLGVVAVGKDGMILEGHFDGMLSRDELGALASGAFDNITTGIDRIKFGKPLDVLIEAEQSKLWMISFDKALIVISMRDDVNLGSLRLKVNEIFKNTVMG